MVTDTPLQVALLLLVLAAPVLWVWRHPVSATVAILAYLAFEELVLLAVPESFYAAARLGPDVLLYVACASACWKAWRRWRELQIHMLWPEWALLGTLGFGLVVALARRVEPLFIVVGVRWLFRYLPLYVIWRLEGSDVHRSRLLRVTTVVVFAQAAIGVGQALLQWAGIPILDAMQAAVGSADVGGVDIVTGGSKQKLGLPFYVFGTLGRYHRYGIFLAAAGLIPTFLLIYRSRRGLLLQVGLGVTALGLLLSTSREAFLLAGLSILGVAWLKLGLSDRMSRLIRGMSILGGVGGGLLFVSGVLAALRGESSFVARLLNIGTLGFRAYYLVVIIPRVLRFSHFLGFGVGTFGSRPHVLAYPQKYLQLGFPGTWSLQYTYDSEWAILLGQYGVPGLLMFYGAILGFGWLAWRALTRRPDFTAETRVVLATAACLTSALPIMGGVGAELGSRTTAYIVWAMIGAAMSCIFPVTQQDAAEPAL